MTGAAPIWADVIQFTVDRYQGGSPSEYVRPDTIWSDVICKVGGAEPSERCPKQITEIFAEGQPPVPADEDMWRKVEIDTWTQKKSSMYCSEFTKESWTLNIEDEWARKWLTDSSRGRQ